MKYYNYYYLVYKNKFSSILWITDESDDLNMIIDKIDTYDIVNLRKYNEGYFVFMKTYNKLQYKIKQYEKFKGFKQFDIDSKTDLIYQLI